MEFLCQNTTTQFGLMCLQSILTSTTICNLEYSNANLFFSLVSPILSELPINFTLCNHKFCKYLNTLQFRAQTYSNLIAQQATKKTYLIAINCNYNVFDPNLMHIVQTICILTSTTPQRMSLMMMAACLPLKCWNILPAWTPRKHSTIEFKVPSTPSGSQFNLR